MEVEHCEQSDEEEIENFFHQTIINVDKRWPDDMEGNAEGDRAAERQAQRKQRRQPHIDYTLRGFHPRCLRRRAQDYLLENPNTT